MTQQERAEKILQGFRDHLSYQGIQDHYQIKKGVMWGAVVKLCECGKLVKTGTGKYHVNEDAPMPSFGRKEYTRRVDKILPFKQPVAAVEAPPPAPLPEPKKEDDIEEIATDLLDKIGALQPLLLLHRDLFEGIEKATMRLVEHTIQIKPRILTSEQLEEYKELCSFKERAISIAQQRHYKR